MKNQVQLECIYHMFMEEEEFQQQELFETEKYISDLVEEKTKKRGSSLNLVFLSF